MDTTRRVYLFAQKTRIKSNKAYATRCVLCARCVKKMSTLRLVSFVKTLANFVVKNKTFW